MTFLTPLLAGVVAAITVPTLIILYFLKLRRRDLEVSTTLLWRKAIQDLQANAPFQKLRRNILLLLQLIVLGLALFGLAQPEFRADTPLGQRSIILIDRSASMNATDGDPKAAIDKVTRLAAAKKKARDFVDSLREPGVFTTDKGDEAMVIAFDSTAAVVQNFTTDKALLRQAIEGVEPTDSPTSVEAAFKLAKAYTGTQKFEQQVQEHFGFVPAGPGAVIHLFSDGRILDAEKVATALEDTVVYHAVGQPDAANIGITGLQAQRAFNDPSKLSIFVGLSNTSHQPRTVDVQLAIDEKVQSVRPVTVPAAAPAQGSDSAPTPAASTDSKTDAKTDATKPDAAKTDAARNAAGEIDWRPGVGGVVFTLPHAEGGIVTMQIRAPEADALPTDDIAYLVFPPAKRLSLLLVSSSGFFIKSALEGLELNKFETMTPEQFQKALDSGKTGEFDLFVFDDCLPKVKSDLDKSGTVQGLPPGRSLVFGAIPNVRGGKNADGTSAPGLIDEGESGQALIVDWVRDHRALKHAALDTLTIAKSHKVRIGLDAPVQVIAKTQEGPAILEVTDGPSHAIVVPFDPIRSTWPLDPGFLLFIAESMTYLTDTGIEAKMVHPGGNIAEVLPPGAKETRLTLPDRTPIELTPAPDGSVSYNPVTKVGIYTVSWVGQPRPTDEVVGGRVRRPIAANLLDPEESNIAAREKLPMAREVVEAEESSGNLRRRLWPWLLLGALAFVMLEWFVYNKKVHI